MCFMTGTLEYFTSYIMTHYHLYLWTLMIQTDLPNVNYLNVQYHTLSGTNKSCSPTYLFIKSTSTMHLWIWLKSDETSNRGKYSDKSFQGRLGEILSCCEFIDSDSMDCVTQVRKYIELYLWQSPFQLLIFVMGLFSLMCVFECYPLVLRASQVQKLIEFVNWNA